MGSMVGTDLRLSFGLGLWVCIFIDAFCIFAVGVCIVVDSFSVDIKSYRLGFHLSTLSEREGYVH